MGKIGIGKSTENTLVPFHWATFYLKPTNKTKYNF